MLWNEIRLRRLFTATGGSWGVEPVDGEISMPCIRAADFDYVRLQSNTVRAPLRGYTRADVRSRAARAGDLIIEKSGGGEQQPVGRAVLHRSATEVMPTNFAGRLRPSRGDDPRFLCYLMSSLYANGRTTVAIKQTTGIQNLDMGALLDEHVRVPPEGSQRQIADYLEGETARIDALIAKKEQLRARLLERRRTLTYVAVAGGLRGGTTRKDSRIPWVPSIPEHWREAPLTLVARLGSGHTPSRERPEWWMDCMIPWVTTGEVAQMRSDRIEFITETRECISELGLANSAAELHPAGTVVLSRTASAGFSAIMGRAMATSQDFVTWTCGPLLEPRFLLLCLRAMRADLLDRLAQGSTHKTIYMPDIKSIRVPLPPVDEQRDTVVRTWDELRKLDGVVERLEEQVSLLREHRQALITAAVTGELEIPGVA